MIHVKCERFVDNETLKYSCQHNSSERNFAQLKISTFTPYTSSMYGNLFQSSARRVSDLAVLLLMNLAIRTTYAVEYIYSDYFFPMISVF